MFYKIGSKDCKQQQKHNLIEKETKGYAFHIKELIAQVVQGELHVRVK